MRALALAASLVLAACSSDEVAGANGDGGSSGAPPENCQLRDDTSGQYSDSCVARSFIEEYAGKYISPTCTLEIDVRGAIPAVFTVTISGTTLAGTHTVDWEGGAAGAGNDSYYRFTTDSTRTTTKALNFNAGAQLEGGGEANLSLRVNDLDTGAPTFTGLYSELRGGSEESVDCGAYTRQ